MDTFLFILAIGFIAFIVFLNWNADRRQLSEARTAYLASLGQLKDDPTNADLKQRTLALGREYSNLTRASKGVTIYDELALSNDISAACAAAPRQDRPPAGQPESADARLRRLADLNRQGLISDTELQEQRGRILRDI